MSNDDVSGWFARDPSILHHVGHILLQLKPVEPRRARRLVFANDLFQLSKVPKQKTVHVVSKAIEKLSGCKFQGLQFLFISVAFFWPENHDSTLLLPLLLGWCEFNS